MEHAERAGGVRAAGAQQAVERSQFHAATAWLYAGSSASYVAANSKANQAWFGECDFFNQSALVVGTDRQPWLFNMTVHDCEFADNDNDKPSSPLVALLNGNWISEDMAPAHTRLSKSRLLRSTDVVSVLEDLAVDNANGSALLPFLHEVHWNNVTTAATGQPRTRATMTDCDWEDNAQQGVVAAAATRGPDGARAPPRPP